MDQPINRRRGDTECDTCGDRSDSDPDLPCGRVDDHPGATPCPGTYRDVDQTWYHGLRRPGSTAVVAVVDDQGQQIRLLRHHVRHSPDGFEWGYLGSGPAELARCILLDALDDPHCPTCHGTHKITPNASDQASDQAGEQAVPCYDCDSSGLAAVPYQQFKEEVVARWTGDEWRFPRSQAQAWLATHTGGKA